MGEDLPLLRSTRSSSSSSQSAAGGQIGPLGACIHAPRAASTCSPASGAGLDGVKSSEEVNKSVQ